jgi:4-diphosphocytidyl-2C-methyl-D-erythritol kinase
VGLPTDTVNSSVGTKSLTPLSQSPHLAVLKVVIHGNVPGSYAFNRHRRLRWNISLLPTPNASTPLMISEQHFDNDMKPRLLQTFANGRLDSEMARGKVVNRSWSGSGPSDSTFFLLRDDEQDLEEEATAESGSEEWLANSKLYAFPGFVFEVLENGAVSALTVC